MLVLFIISFIQVSGYENQEPVIIEIKCPSNINLGENFNVEIWIDPNGEAVQWWFIDEFHWSIGKVEATGDPDRNGYRGNGTIIDGIWETYILGTPDWTNGTIHNVEGKISTIQSIVKSNITNTTLPGFLTTKALLCTIPFKAVGEGICNFYIYQRPDLVGNSQGAFDYSIFEASVLIISDEQPFNGNGNSDGNGDGENGNGENGGTPPTPNQPPFANAGGPYLGMVNDSITFSAVKSNDDGFIKSCDWDFGDGTLGSGMTAVHSYSEIGNYTIILLVYDNEGAYDTDTTYAHIKYFIPEPPDDTNGDEEPPDNGDDDEEPVENGKTEDLEGGLQPAYIVIAVIVVIVSLVAIFMIYNKKKILLYVT